MERFNQTNRHEQYKVWNEESTLQVSDFLRRPPFYEGEASARISYMYRIYDNPEIKVAIVIDRFNSFIHKRHVSEYLVRHEAYHLKLAHFFSKEINQSIKEKNLTFQEANQFLLDRIQRGRQYQKLYDRETNHSQLRAQQNYWEYKIDSMLNKSNDFRIFEETKNVKVYFPDKPREFVLSIDDENFKGYLLERFDVGFWIVDMDFISGDTLFIENYLVNILFAEGQSDIIVNADLPNEKAIFESYSKDTLGTAIVLDKFLLGKNTSYWLRFRYPIVIENEEIYKRMADQFFNSFEVIDE
ncbi:hypothetical protein ACFSKL_02255 [Belliella marina]|uniref:DUF45 domain-containing protein n=1 Tax=Belliella marina TaxID=1644146 RepID=A0ABW4VHP6_9BACT